MDAPDYVVDPDDPRAPPLDVWNRLSAEQRAKVVASLPSEWPRAHPPEGDPHRVPKARAMETLDAYFRRKGRSVYIGSELATYYPGEPMIAPDMFVVLDVEPHQRDRWVVVEEGKGLDFVLEVHVRGERKKDLERNVVRYARMGIPEYFVFLPKKHRLVGFRLDGSSYQTIMPQGGFWQSSVLGLQLGLEGEQLRFFTDTAPLPFARELIDRLGSLVDDFVKRADTEAQRADTEAQRADTEAQRADTEAQRADTEAQRADSEARAKERFAAKLRELGIDPSTLDD